MEKYNLIEKIQKLQHILLNESEKYYSIDNSKVADIICGYDVWLAILIKFVEKDNIQAISTLFIRYDFGVKGLLRCFPRYKNNTENISSRKNRINAITTFKNILKVIVKKLG